MKVKLVSVGAALICLAMIVHAQKQSKPQAAGAFVGTWEGKMNDMPGVKLTISESEGKIAGLMIFYYQERKDENSPWRVAAEHPVELLSPRVENKTLSFEVQHHKCHGCAELGPNVKFRMEVSLPNEASLWMVDASTGKDSGPEMKLLRSKEATKSTEVGNKQ